MEAADFLALNVKCLMQGATWRMSDFDFFPFQEAGLSWAKMKMGQENGTGNFRDLSKQIEPLPETRKMPGHTTPPL